MNAPANAPPMPVKALRKLFLTLFLRGRSSRGLRRETAPKSVGSKLALVLGAYTLIGGFMALAFLHQDVFALSLYLHFMTLMFLGMFVAASAGEVLFNKDEADILMHRPVTPRAMLWAKISVLVQVSIWMGAAFNLGGFFVGAFTAHPGWLFPFVHAFSTACEALFCTGCVVMIYQLCLRWFGRERMEGLMTTAQVFVAVGAVLLGQLGPQLIGRFGMNLKVVDSLWMAPLPPAWFAGFDDALTGSGGGISWILGGTGLAVTAVVLWLAFGKLADSYETGLQALNEATAAPAAGRGHRRWLEVMIKAPPLSWWLRNSVERASFRLTAAYLLRDRDVKLRIYPGIAPMLVMPVIIMLPMAHAGRGATSEAAGPFSGFLVGFAGAYLGLIPFMGLTLMRYSQQWQAADLFRIAPMSGPAPLCHGARRAVLFILALPTLLIMGGLVLLVVRDSSKLAMLLPGALMVPLYALLPCLGGHAVPLSLPTEEAKAAGRALIMYVVMFVAAGVAAIASLAHYYGWFQWFLLMELIVTVAVYVALRSAVSSARWEPID